MLVRRLELRAALKQGDEDVQGLRHVGAAASGRRRPREQLVQELCAACAAARRAQLWMWNCAVRTITTEKLKHTLSNQ